MAEPPRLEDVIAKHEPETGGHHCSCQPVDEDGRREHLGVYWETHLAQAIRESGAR